MITHGQRAQILSEALPYIQKFYGKTVVVKYGGAAMISEIMQTSVLRDCILLTLCGINVVLVHGGGPEINEMMKKMGKESRFIDGLRYTDEETVDIVQMSLAGKVNKDLVAKINIEGGHAIGLCGIDAGLLMCKKLTGKNDYGFVGKITSVNCKILNDAISSGYLPVVATVACGEDGHSYNINADSAAAKIASSLGAEKLLLLTDIRGVLRNKNDENTLIPRIKLSDIDRLTSEGIIQGGMIPKLECCRTAVAEGVGAAVILDGRTEHSILIELFSDGGYGTLVFDDKGRPEYA